MLIDKTYNNSLNLVDEAVSSLFDAHIEANKGLPENLFLMISSLIPIVNVDLLIIERKQILLSWRDDPFYGKGWHIPGGCIRFGETMKERVQKTAIDEIGTPITMDQEPVAVRDVIRPPVEGLKDKNIRGHNLAILFRCYLPDNFIIDNHGKDDFENGYLKWFDRLPDNLLSVHGVYKNVLKKYI